MKAYKYIIALVVLVFALFLILTWKSPRAPVATDTVSSSTETPATPSVPAASTSTDTGVHTAAPSYVSVVPQQPAAATPKISYLPASTTNDIHITSPIAGATVSAAKPIVVTGQAVGSWYFEAVFPITLASSDGKVISQAKAQAGGDWMTTKFVPFSASITFVQQVPGTHGFVILKKDNPSGLPQNDASVEIPVVFQ